MISNESVLDRSRQSAAIEKSIKKLLIKKQKLATFKTLLDIVPNATLSPKLSRQICLYLLQNQNVVSRCKILLIWIIGLLEYDLIDFESVNLFYHHYFNLLQCNQLVPLTCKLLYMLTKDEYDIKRTTVQKLIDIKNFGGSTKHVLGLLMLFKTLRPDLVPESIPSHNLTQSFPLLPIQFRDRLEETVARNRLNKSVHICWDVLKNQQKSDSIVPSITYLNVGRSLEEKQNQDFDREILRNGELTIEAFTSSMKTLSNASALLHDENSIYLIIFGDNILKLRMLLYLQQTLRYEFRENSKASFERRQQLFITINNLLEHAQQGIPIISDIMLEYFNEFLGFQLDEIFLNILSWTVVTSFDHLRDNLLIPLKNILICEYDSRRRCAIINCISRLVQNFIICQVYMDVIEGEQPFNLPAVQNDNTILRELGKWIARFTSEATKIGDLSIINTILNLHQILINLQMSMKPIIWSGITPPRLTYTCLMYSLNQLDTYCSLFQQYIKVYKETNQTSPSEEHNLLRLYFSDFKNIFVKNHLKLFKSKSLSVECTNILKSHNANYKIENHIAIFPYMCATLRQRQDVSRDVAVQVCNVNYVHIAQFLRQLLLK